MKKSIVGLLALTCFTSVSYAGVCETVAISVSSGESANNTPENSTNADIFINFFTNNHTKI